MNSPSKVSVNGSGLEKKTTPTSVPNTFTNPNILPHQQTKKTFMMEKDLPLSIEDYLPEAQESLQYKKLKAIEAQLDFKILKKQLDIQEASYNTDKFRRVLRIYLSNTVADLTLSEPSLVKVEEGGKDVPVSKEIKIPSWTFRIEGYLIDSAGKRISSLPKKFSSFFKSITIEIESKNVHPSYENLFQWVKTTLGKETDGFEVRRRIYDPSQPIPLKIYLRQDHFIEKFKTTPELANICHMKHGACESKPFILKSLWRYIFHHGLFHQQGENTIIKNNEELKFIFGCDVMTLSSLNEKLQGHLSPPDPIVLSYTIHLNRETSNSAYAYDIFVDLPMIDTNALHKKYFQMNQQQMKELSFLDQKMSEILSLIHNAHRKRTLLENFKNNPNSFIIAFIDSQAATENILALHSSAEPIDAPSLKLPFEEFSKSSFYKNANWLNGAIFQYLNSRIS